MVKGGLEQAVHAVSGGVAVRVKVVPGASRTRIAGLLGDRLKIAVAAPPEGGKANRMATDLLAACLGVTPGSVSVVAGHSRPQKTIEVAGLRLAEALARLEPQVE